MVLVVSASNWPTSSFLWSGVEIESYPKNHECEWGNGHCVFEKGRVEARSVSCSGCVKQVSFILTVQTHTCRSCLQMLGLKD
jgi:hypothetical protein